MKLIDQVNILRRKIALIEREIEDDLLARELIIETSVWARAVLETLLYVKFNVNGALLNQSIPLKNDQGYGDASIPLKKLLNTVAHFRYIEIYPQPDHGFILDLQSDYSKRMRVNYSDFIQALKVLLIPWSCPAFVDG